MKKTIMTLTLAALLPCIYGCKKGPAKAEQHGAEIIKEISKLKSSIEGKRNNTAKAPIFIAVWDFDGTILRGDCTEGYSTPDKGGYRGLAELCIKEGLSKKYPPGKFSAFMKDYRSMEEKDRLRAYGFIPSIYAGAPVKKILDISRRHFDTVLKKHLFATSSFMLNELKEMKVYNYVISASPDFFVKGASDIINVPSGMMHGIEVEIKDGIVTDTLVKPVTYAEGKAEKLREIIKGLSDHHDVYVLAGFGNSYHTDGEFLKWIAEQKLPGGNESAITVMINGGDTPAKYKGLFRKVSQKVITGK